MRFSFRSGSTAEIEAMMRDGEIDVGLTLVDRLPDGLQWEPLLTLKLGLLVVKSWRVAAADRRAWHAATNPDGRACRALPTTTGGHGGGPMIPTRILTPISPRKKTVHAQKLHVENEVEQHQARSHVSEAESVLPETGLGRAATAKREANLHVFDAPAALIASHKPEPRQSPAHVAPVNTKAGCVSD